MTRSERAVFDNLGITGKQRPLTGRTHYYKRDRDRGRVLTEQIIISMHN